MLLSRNTSGERKGCGVKACLATVLDDAYKQDLYMATRRLMSGDTNSRTPFTAARPAPAANATGTATTAVQQPQLCSKAPAIAAATGASS